jgi:hypothetical protein
MKKMTLVFEVKVAWWLAPYLHTLAFLCDLFDADPDDAAVSRMIGRACRVRLKTDVAA